MNVGGLSLALLVAAATCSTPAQTSHGVLRIDGFDLHYSIEGKGPPCLVIGSSMYYPRTFSSQLLKHFRFTFVDLPWFAKGRSVAPLPAFNLNRIIREVEEIRVSLRLHGFMLIGHSIHGTIAFEYAKKYPKYITRLVMINSPDVLGSREYDRATDEVWSRASPKRKLLQKENWANLPDFRKHPNLQPDVENYLAMAPKYWKNPRFDARWLWAGMTVQSDLLNHLFNDVFKGYRMFDSPPRVSVPTLATVGDYDFIVPASLWKPYVHVPGLTVVEFKNAGHTPQLEIPVTFDQLLLRWCRVVRSKPRRNLAAKAGQAQ